MLLVVPVGTAHIQNLPEAVRVHHFQPVSLLLSESPRLTAKQQHRQHIGTETLDFELDTLCQAGRQLNHLGSKDRHI
jgi:hypothetical protein